MANTSQIEDSRILQDENYLHLRRQLIASFHDGHVHGSFEQIFADIPPEMRGEKPAGQPFTLWRLLEHLRLCVVDFLDQCRVPGYVERPVPEGYWPVGDAPPDATAWEESYRGFQSSMQELEALLLDPATDLLLPIPSCNGRNVLRQALACLDHNGYHLGQAMLIRRLLKIWAE